MNKFVIAIFLFLISFTLFAQEEPEAEKDNKAAIGLGLEWNMNARENFAGGAAVSFDYNIGRLFAAGLNVNVSSNLSGILVLEHAALFRWYLLKKGHKGLFAQAEAGTYLVFEDDEILPTFLGGIRAGYRVPLGKAFYLEPYGRFGYPFMFGVGVNFGGRF